MITKIERFDAELFTPEYTDDVEVVMEECRLGDYVKYTDVNKMFCEIRDLCKHETPELAAKHITDLLIRK